MKIRLILYILSIALYLTSNGQSANPYSKLNFTTVDGFVMNSKMFQDKAIIITVFDPNNPDKAVLKVLDSIQRKYYQTLSVIGIPITDSVKANALNAMLALMRDTLHLSFPISQVVKSKNKVFQNVVYDLMNDPSNKHFELSNSIVNQTWLLDSKGRSYCYFRDNQHLTFDLIETLMSQRVSR